MTKIHEDLDPETFEAPKGIVKAKVCPYTGMYESYSARTEYANSKFLTGYCGGKNHSKYVGWTKDAPIYSSDTKKEDTEKKEENDGETSSNDGESNTSSSNDVTETESPTPPVETPEPPPAPSEPTDIPHI